MRRNSSKKIKSSRKLRKAPAVPVVPEERLTGKTEPYAYTITDKHFGEFKVLSTANAWWIDQIKVRDLISAFKIDATIEEACAYAGISIAQFNYFRELHAEFSEIISICRQLPTLKARKVVVDHVDENYQNGMDYLKRKHKKEFSERHEIEKEVQHIIAPQNIEEINKALDGLTP